VVKQLGRLEEADAITSEAERICRETGTRRVLAIALMNRGIIARVANNSARSLVFYDEAEGLARAVGDSVLVGSCLANRASAMVELKDYQEADRLLAQAEVLMDSASDLLSRALTLGMRGMSLSTLGRHEEAAGRLARTFEMLRQNQTRSLDAMVAMRAAWAFSEAALGNCLRAQELARETLEDAARMGMTEHHPDGGVRDALAAARKILAPQEG
jgi:tetratricopeptide (TPR) repeat protein